MKTWNELLAHALLALHPRHPGTIVPVGVLRTIRRPGVFAFDRRLGYAYDFDSEARARRTALNNCARHAPDCQVVITFFDQCGALAETLKYEVSPGLGKTRKDAEDRSLAACRSAGGKNCSVAAWTCSGI